MAKFAKCCTNIETNDTGIFCILPVSNNLLVQFQTNETSSNNSLTLLSPFGLIYTTMSSMVVTTVNKNSMKYHASIDVILWAQDMFSSEFVSVFLSVTEVTT